METGEAVAIFVVGAVLGGIAVHVYLTRFKPTSANDVGPSRATHNKEVWEYDDWQGKKKRIEVARVIE